MNSEQAPRIVWFEVAADNIQRAKSFYNTLFGWKIERMPGPMEYWHIATGGGDESPDGGLMQRKAPDQRITNYIAVPSVSEWAARVEKSGGKVCMPKTAVPNMGYFAICMDTEQNVFGLWEMDPNAK